MALAFSVTDFDPLSAFEQTLEALGQGRLAHLGRCPGYDNHFHGSEAPSQPTLLEASQLTLADFDAILIAYPANVFECYAVLAVNLKSAGARNDFSSVPLDHRLNHELLHA
jgi:hypothetical protein